jgi:hypothetical protein
MAYLGTKPANQVIDSTLIADGTVTTADLANEAVTGAKLENSGVTAGTYGSASAIPAVTVDAKGRITSVTTNAVTGGVTSLLGATGAVSSGGITAGTTYSLYDSTLYAGTSGFGQAGLSYVDWRNSAIDTLINIDSGNYLGGSQIGFIMFNAGVYRFTWKSYNGAAGTSNASRILVSGTEVYSVATSGTTPVTRTFDVTVRPFDVVVLQVTRTGGTNAFSGIQEVKITSSNGGTIIPRNSIQ